MKRTAAVYAAVLAASWVFPATEALAADAKDLVGTWKLVSYQRVDDATKKKTDLFGEKPTGYVTYLPNGRYIGVLTGSGRKPFAAAAATDAERAEAYKTMISGYSARYKVEGGNKLVYDVDVAWNPGWVGKQQMRDFKLEGDKLMVTNHGTSTVDGGKFTSNLVFVREK